MIGYLKPKIDDLHVYEYKQYRSYYCGICVELKKQQGELPRLLLSNDITFFALLLSSVFDVETIDAKHRCSLHGYKKKAIKQNIFTRYMSDMNTIFAYGKIKDNLLDEGGMKARTGSVIYHHTYKRIRKQYPREADLFKNYVEELHKQEVAKSSDYASLGKLFGNTLREIFQSAFSLSMPSDMSNTTNTKLKQQQLSDLFDYIGQWIYCIDALDDIESDQKENSFNPMLSAFTTDKQQFLTEVEQHINNILLQIVYLYTDMEFVDYKGIVFNVLCISMREKSDSIFKRYKETI